MRSQTLSQIVEKKEHRQIPLHSLMPWRVHKILLVSSLYDSFTFEQDGRLTEVLFSEYIELNLHWSPGIVRVSTAEGALERIQSEKFDLVISMQRVGGMDISEFCRKAKKINPDLPIVLLCYHTRELALLESRDDLDGIEGIYSWHGDVRLFLAIIKSIEDRHNVEHDTTVAGVQCIILIEDSISFYSSYIPMLYTEIVQQTQDLMAYGLNRMEKFIRMRARPKILHVTNYDEALKLYRKYKEYVLGVITDVSVPKGGKIDKTAGLEFGRMVREETWDRAVLVQSSEESHREAANKISAYFINKNSPTLLNDIREFMQDHLGFGDFVFRTPDQRILGRAGDLRSLESALHEIPDESLLYHVSRNHFSRWLMARTEFDLARALRPRQPEEFDSPDLIREYLIKELNKSFEEKRSGVVADFSTGTFHPNSMFVRVGDGSLGGKGRGLAFIYSLLDRFNVEDHVPGVNIYVPPTTVLTTDVFEEFMESNNLSERVLAETDDDKITRILFNAKLPDNAVNLLGEFLTRVHYPLAVRSSSLQEDASSQPFAGIYRTYMLSNAHEDFKIKLKELCNAVKMVYASTYYSDPRSYFEAIPNRLEEERMAIIIQEIVGKRHGDYVYPNMAGVARSYDYYPVKGMDPTDGIVNVALGLGKTVVDGGKSVRFSPKYPEKLYQFSSVNDYLDNSQREFYALDMTKPGPALRERAMIESNLVKLGLDVAENHGTLSAVASTWVAANDAVYDGISRKGVRIVTMAGVLKHDRFPLAESLQLLMEIGEAAFSCPVEVEFAVNFRKPDEGPDELGFLQIRPLMVGSDIRELKLDGIDPVNAICITPNALGQGITSDVRDLVYVRDDNFDRGKTVEIASEIEVINQRLRTGNRNYILIGPGRWGTADRFFGVPVSWAQISMVAAFIETDIKGISVQPSQGTHFFHNITSFGIPYFTVNFSSGDSTLDMDWLNEQPSAFETEHVRLLSFNNPLEIAVDGRSRKGIVMKPGLSIG